MKIKNHVQAGIVLLALAVSLTACGSSASSTASSVASSVPASSVAESTAPEAKPASTESSPLDGISFRADKVRHNANGLCHGRLQEHAKEQAAGSCRTGKKACHPGLPVQLLPPSIKEERHRDQQHDNNNGYHHAGLDVDTGRSCHARSL